MARVRKSERCADHDPPHRLFVHFGVHKTGSSSIQETLFASRPSLKALTYLVANNRANSSLLVRNAFDTDKRLDSGSGRRSRAEVREVGRRMFVDMCSAACSTATAVLSAEAIAHLPPQGLEDMHGLLARHWPEITYVGYIRDPVSYARSAFQERLKKSIEQGFPFAEGSRLTLNYHQIVQRLDAMTGREAVDVFAFDRSQFPGGDVVRHFLEVVGAADIDVPTRQVNEGLSGTAVKALYAYRRLRVSNDLAIGHAPSRRHFVKALSDIRGPAFALDASIEDRVRSANAHIYDWAEERLGQPLRPSPAPDRPGIREEPDLLLFTESERDELSRWAKTYDLRGPSAAAGAETVADLLADLRLRFAHQASNAAPRPSHRGRE